MLDRIARGSAGLFEPCRPSPPSVREPWELPLLLLIILAGTFLRFWGVGGWGLENDEETMAMPVMHILKDGLPVLPSGMFYARGIAQLYMMAASVKVFGPTEWALRLPSVLCGIVFIPLVYLYGKRFLAPVWCFALAATAAFLPGFIADSQEARMYIFMLASLAGFGVLVFEWERTGRPGFLVAAVAVMLVGLQFHVLTVFGVFILFMPGMLQGDGRKLMHAALAFGVIVAGYFLISSWVSSFYPPSPPMHGVKVVLDEHGGGLTQVMISPLLLGIAVAISAAVSVFVARGVRAGPLSLVVGALMVLGFGAQIAFYNHAGLLLLIAATITYCRQPGARRQRLMAMALWSLILLIAEFVALHHGGTGSSRKVIGAMIGLPSIWPIFRIAQYSYAALTMLTLLLMQALWRCSQGRRIGDQWLLFALGAWLPLLLLGIFSWNVEARYTEFALLPLFVCVLASLQSLTSNAALRASMAVIAGVLIINPLQAARVVNAGYTIHPDHKGAAEFIRAQHPGPDDLVLAEDVNQQTYYLGHVDYWLISQDIADVFSEIVDGEQRDNYTHTRIIGSGGELMALVNRPVRGRIFVIGSGEDQQDGRRLSRAHGIFEALLSPQFRVVYDGRDGLTKVWVVDARGPAP